MPLQYVSLNHLIRYTHGKALRQKFKYLTDALNLTTMSEHMPPTIQRQCARTVKSVHTAIPSRQIKYIPISLSLTETGPLFIRFGVPAPRFAWAEVQAIGRKVYGKP